MTDRTPPLPPGSGTDRVTLPDAEPQTIAATAVALANTDGGLLVFPDLPEHAITRALAAAVDCCAPALPLSAPHDIVTPDGPALAIYVARGERVHALDDGRVLVRAGTGNRELSGAEIRQLLSARRMGEFETEIVPGAAYHDLDPDLIGSFVYARAAHTGGNGFTPDDLLCQIGALTASGAVTVMGLLLFGRDPARWLPGAGAHFVRSVGDQQARQDTIDGPLVHVLHVLAEIVRTQTRSSDAPDYPADAVREALFNAICHRDYRLRGERLSVALHSDRLTITSPGGLPGYLTATQHMLGARYRRNPRLRWALEEWGTSDGSAQGILGMIMSMSLHGQRPPEIETGPYHVTVRLYSARAATAMPRADAAPDTARLTDRQREILTYAQMRGSITLREARVHCNNALPAHLQADIDALVEAGHLRKIGARRNTYYILT